MAQFEASSIKEWDFMMVRILVFRSRFVNGFPLGSSAIPTGFDIKLPPLSREFDKSVTSKDREDCQH